MGYDSAMPNDEYLDIAGVAREIGVGQSTVRKYKAEGRMPKPDITIGGSPGWKPATIAEWKATRPGQGAGGGRPAADPMAAIRRTLRHVPGLEFEMLEDGAHFTRPDGLSVLVRPGDGRYEVVHPGKGQSIAPFTSLVRLRDFVIDLVGTN